MEEQTRAKEICDADRKRFRRLYDEEWERKRVKRLCSRFPPKITQKNEDVLARELERDVGHGRSNERQSNEQKSLGL